MHQSNNSNYESNKIADSVMTSRTRNHEGNLPDCHGTPAVKVFSPSTNMQLSQSTHGSAGKTKQNKNKQTNNNHPPRWLRKLRATTYAIVKIIGLPDFQRMKRWKIWYRKNLMIAVEVRSKTLENILCVLSVTCQMATEDLYQCLLRKIFNVLIKTGISSCPLKDQLMGLKCSTPNRIKIF